MAIIGGLWHCSRAFFSRWPQVFLLLTSCDNGILGTSARHCSNIVDIEHIAIIFRRDKKPVLACSALAWHSAAKLKSIVV